MMEIRITRPSDAAELRAIYGQYIATPVTFEYELPSIEAFAQRIAETLLTYPYLTAAEDGRIAGYAYAGKFAARPAYQWGAELSVYLAADAVGRGYGTRLYLQLIEILKKQGVQTVYACVTTPNPASEHFHEKTGFQRIGCFQRAGFKNGAWHDVTWFGKAIAVRPEPEPLIPFDGGLRGTL